VYWLPFSRTTPKLPPESRLCREFTKTGRFRRRGGEFIVIEVLSGMADAQTLIIPVDRQPTHTYLAARCDMSETTLKRHLTRLAKHNWVYRIRGGGLGNPTRYELHVGDPCDCRPKPMTGAERQRKYSERKREAKPVTLGLWLTFSSRVTKNRVDNHEKNPEQPDDLFSSAPQVKRHFPTRGSDSTWKHYCGSNLGLVERRSASGWTQIHELRSRCPALRTARAPRPGPARKRRLPGPRERPSAKRSGR
jgi:hypothetical protein